MTAVESSSLKAKIEMNNSPSVTFREKWNDHGIHVWSYLERRGGGAKLLLVQQDSFDVTQILWEPLKKLDLVVVETI